MKDSEKKLNADIKFALDESSIVAISDWRGVISYVNDKFCAISGYARQELLGQSPRILCSGYHSKEFTRNLWETISSGKVWKGEVKQTTKDGTFYWLDTTIVPFLDESGKPYQYIATHYEITERKRIEEKCAQEAEAAIESVRLKSDFLANMSHEIRTPMNGIIGMTGLLLNADLSECQTGFAKAIESSSEALLKIIDDILDFSKIEAGHVRFETIDFDLREAVELTVEIFAGQAQAKNIEIASLVYSEVPTRLCGDPNRLRQILTNLIGNAIKFTEKGEVMIKVSKDSETSHDAVVRFEIKDTGIGISEDARRKLFKAFVQADGSTTRKYGGTGLGLAISKQLVGLMGGEIGVESTPGESSTFWFTARFEKQTAREVPAQPFGAASLAGKRVLIVDDNASNRKILHYQTASWGMKGTVAESGAQALDLLRVSGQPFDIAILDLKMPEMDGFDLARAIQNDPDISDLRRVLLPSFGKKNSDRFAREIGIDAYLQKPVGQSQLYNCLVNVIKEKSFIAPDSHFRHLIVQPPFRYQKKAVKLAVSKIRILVAEDNAINREVIINQLQCLGYSPEAVTNGREAVAALKNQNYDLVLMDCQMPEMDGFDATAEIRRLPGNSKHAVIIAMTANALEGDREKCLAARMDNYLAKPVKLETLHQMLDKCIVTAKNRSAMLPAKAEKPARQQAAAIIDISVLAGLSSLQQPGKPDLVNNLINLFIEGTSENLSALEKASAEDDPEAIKREAHKIKGSAGNIGARQMAALCLKLELEARHNAKAEIIISDLHSGFKQVVKVLDKMRKID